MSEKPEWPDSDEILYAIREEIGDCLPTSNEILKAVRDGVADAMWRMMTNATSMPCADFYDSIKEGVEKAIQDVSP
jgi:hypothetical protein